jgi:hypothetical protein
MTTKRTISCVCLIFIALAISTTQATVLRVVVVQTDDVHAYVEEVEQARDIWDELGSNAVVRVCRARFAGTETGTVVGSVEWPDLAAFASDDAKLADSEEWNAWLKKMATKRRIVSDSLYNLLSE